MQYLQPAFSNTFTVLSSLKGLISFVKVLKPRNYHALQCMIVRLTFWMNFAVEQTVLKQSYCIPYTAPYIPLNCYACFVSYRLLIPYYFKTEAFSFQTMQTAVPLITNKRNILQSTYFEMQDFHQRLFFS
jgi:hypothetical protein